MSLFHKAPALQELSPNEVADLLAAGKIHLIDVRENNEWDAGHIEGARLVPLSILPAMLSDLPTDKPVVFHCKAGGRSAQAVALAQRAGLSIDAHMAGGAMAWTAAGLPLVK